jgi:hypothetical protein
MHILIGVIVVLAVNALPFWGVFGWNLDPAQLLVLFWVENVANTVLIGARIVIHRRLTRKRGHWSVATKTTTRINGVTRTKASTSGSALVSFLIPCGVFTAAHGIFVFLLARLLLPESADVDLFSAQVVLAAKGLLLAMVLGFVSDLVGISERPFAWIRQMSEVAFGRVVAIHLLLLGGIFAMAVLGSSKIVLGALLAVKLLADLASVLPQAKMKDEPPKMLRFLGRFNKPGKESFEDYWRREHRQEESQKARDEEVLTEQELRELKAR